jgi:hypothetical protein
MGDIKTVVLSKAPGGWCVRITENGRTVELRYPTKQFAKAYAEGQAYRLGVTATEDTTIT